MIEEIQQRILAKAAKITRYEQTMEQYRINKLFNIDEKKVHNEFNGQNGSIDGQIRNAEESKVFSERDMKYREETEPGCWLVTGDKARY